MPGAPLSATLEGMRFRWFVLGAAVVVGCSASPGAPEPTGTTEEAVQQCETTVVEGVDVSAGQGTIDWTSVKGAGVDFAIMKATQGTYYTASNFAANWSGTKAAGVIRSAYHFFDPTEDGAMQAQFFLSVVGTLGPATCRRCSTSSAPTGAADRRASATACPARPRPPTSRRACGTFIHAVETATGKKPLIYTYGSYFTSNGVSTAGLDAYPLYIADPVTGSCFNVPSPWTTADFWQWSWTGTVAGINGQVDRDRFIGTLAQLRAFANGPTVADAGTDAGGDAGRPRRQDRRRGGDAAVHVDSGGPVSPEARRGGVARPGGRRGELGRVRVPRRGGRRRQHRRRPRGPRAGPRRRVASSTFHAAAC